eukprot:CAMPEP_0114626740 /NCGR_PEP_ID=MMETSP0168-20121206/11940_1 /TAXON_ID=95228 ORGANISM="Vannella sp., Strain DIVA3 517/6/12" /NCGR_SAMPLE_ID=MMETSP0168 /ASSEMBLY_ACC=CAM_ASM_000044 /LENGTH=418 /DNA_ID=CAMNT_0001838059 /DNA_START=154 /DNA_END=1407 /DNA_ORIENTATION=-
MLGQRNAKSMALYSISAANDGSDWAAAELSGASLLYLEEQREASKKKKLMQIRQKDMAAKGITKEKKTKAAKKKKRVPAKGGSTLSASSLKSKKEKKATAKTNGRHSTTGSAEESDDDDVVFVGQLPSAGTKRERASAAEMGAKKRRKAASASFRPLLTNTYVDVEKPKETEIHECCCMYIEGIPEAACGSMNCMNRMIHVECHPTHCPCTTECQNQRFQRRTYSKLNILETEKKGRGLEAAQFIEEGQFVIEYVGEVISHDTCMDRLEECEKNFYVIALDNGVYIDASKKGNIARFMNHSCNPNCRTEKWLVRGQWRVGIFALRDIDEGTELTFDYQFQRVGKVKQKCYCGAANCRGFLGEKKKAPVPAVKPVEVPKKKPTAKKVEGKVSLADVLDAMLSPPEDPLPDVKLIRHRRL